MQRWVEVLGVSVCLLVAGCIKTRVQLLDHSERAARSPAAVAVLLEKPQREYTVIAVVESNTETVFDSFDDLQRELVVEAARLGGEALILGSESTDSEFIFTGIAMVKSDRKKLSGEVIVYDRGGQF